MQNKPIVCRSARTLARTLALLLLILFAARSVSAISSRARELNSEGEKLLQSGQLEAARAKFKAAVAEDFLFPDPYYNLGVLSRQLGQYDDELRYLNDARQLRPHEEKFLDAIRDHYRFMAERALRNRRFEEAEETARESIKLDKKDPGSLALLIRIYLEAGRVSGYSKEVEKLEAMVRIPPTGYSRETLALAYATLARFHLVTEWYLQAEKEARLAYKTLPDDARIMNIYQQACTEKNPVVQYLNKGITLLESGDSQGAEKAFSHALSNERDRNTLAMRISYIEKKHAFRNLYEAAERYFQGEQLEKAQEALSEAQKNCYDEASSRRVNDLQDRITKKLFRQNKNTASPLTTSQPGDRNFSSSVYYGDQYMEQGDYEQALKNYQKARELKPDDVAVREKIARIGKILSYEQGIINRYQQAVKLKGEGKYQEAQALLLELEKLDREFDGLDRTLGEIFLLMEEPEKAIVHFERHLHQDEGDGRAIFKLGLALAQKGDYESALETLNRARKSLEKADTLQSRRDLEELPREIEKVESAIRRKTITRYFLYGILGVLAIVMLVAIAYVKTALPRWKKKRALDTVQQLISAKKWPEVEAAAKRMLEYPDLTVNEFKNHQYYLARAYLEEGKTEVAIETCKELLRKDHRNQRLRVLLAQAYMKAGTVSEESFDIYRMMFEMEPNNQRLLELMAQYYSQHEMYDELACMVFRKLTSRDPDNKALVRKYVQVLSSRGKIDDEALSAYTRLLQLEPNDHHVRQTLVKGLLQTGDNNRAIQECRILIDADSHNMLVHQMFIKAHFDQGKQAELLEFYDDFLAVYPDNKAVRELYKDLSRKVAAT